MFKELLIILLGLFFLPKPLAMGSEGVGDLRDTLDIWSLSLDEVLNLKVVSAQKTERGLNRTPASVIVITRNEIERYGYRNLQDILNQVPGLYLWNGYHVRGRVNIGIRGFTSSDNVIILVNGVNQVEGVYNEYLLTKVAVPVDAIDRIEVVRGPLSVMYGSGAFFGVINIITNDFEAGSNSSASFETGSDHYLESTARAVVTSEKIKFGITGSGYRTNGMNQPYKDMMSDPSLLKGWGLTTESTTKNMLRDKSAYFNMSLKYKGLTTDMTHTESERGGFLVQPTVEYSPTKRHSTNFMTSYEYPMNKKVKFVGKFSYLTTSSLAFYALNEKDSYFSFGYNSDAYEVEALSFLKPVNSVDLTFGLFHRNVYHATNPAELTGVWGVPYGLHLTRLDIDSRMIENSLFTQLDYAVLNKLEIIGGLRLQQMSPFRYNASGGPPYISQGRQVYSDTYKFEKLYIIPSIAVLYELSERHILKFLYGEALRNPPLGIITDILFSTADDLRFDYPQLVPSKICTYEINYNGYFGRKIGVHTSLFRNELNNLISQYFLNLTDSTTVYYSSNKGEILTHGVEASLQYNPLNNLHLSISCMYQNSEDMTRGIETVDVAYSPQWLGYFKCSYTFAQHYMVFGSGKYVSALLPEYDYEKNARLGMETPAYTEIDAGFSINDLFISGFQFRMNITNLTDTQIFYPVTTLNQFADKGLLGFPRRFFVGFKYEF